MVRSCFLIVDRKLWLFVLKINNNFVVVGLGLIRKIIDQKKKMRKRVMLVTLSPFLLLLMEPLSVLIPSCNSICLALCSGLVRPWGILNQHQFRFFFLLCFVIFCYFLLFLFLALLLIELVKS